jgi:hypothetical protein
MARAILPKAREVDAIERVEAVLHDPVQYIETFLSVRDEASGNLLPFKLNRAQKHVLAEKKRAVQEKRPRRFLILKSRRLGASSLEMALNFWRAATRRNQQVVSIAHDGTSAERIFRISTTFYENLAPRFRPHRLTGHSKESLDFDRLGSLYYHGTAGSRAFTRGDTLQRAHLAEVAYFPGSIADQEQFLAGVLEAARAGEVTLESTANGIGGLFHGLWEEATSGGGSEWTAIFMPWWFDERNSLPAETGSVVATAEERELMSHHGLTLAQVAWRREKKRTLKTLFDQEYPESPETAFLVTGEAFLEPQRIQELLRGCPDPLEARPDGVRIWERPVPGRPYVAGADVAEGVPKGDWSVCAILDARSLAQVAVLRGRWTPDEFARRSAKLCEEYNKALLAPERQNHGHAMILALRQLGYPRIYYHQDYSGAGAIREGWPTDLKTRPVMLDDLRKSLAPGLMTVRDKVFVSELRTFCPDAGGTYRAKEGQHDDCVLAWAIAGTTQVRQAALAGHPPPKVETPKSPLQEVHANAIDRFQQQKRESRRASDFDG